LAGVRRRQRRKMLRNGSASTGDFWSVAGRGVDRSRPCRGAGHHWVAVFQGWRCRFTPGYALMSLRLVRDPRQNRLPPTSDHRSSIPVRCLRGGGIGGVWRPWAGRLVF
jgi:hypothetical protein